MSGIFSKPKAPNPYDTAYAQSAYNDASARYQAGLNQTNQVTPYGSLTYSGVNNGQPGSVTATTHLGPQEQQIFDNLTNNQITQGQIEGNQLGQLKGELSTPFNLDDAAGQRIDALQRTRLDPLWQQNSENFQQDMANRGIHPGSQAYNMAKEQFDQSKNDAYNQMYIGDQQNAVQQALAARNQPINELSALQSGSQVQQPTFVNTPQTQVAGTNLSGLVESNYQNKLNSYNSTMGGLFGLGGTLGGAAMRYGF